MPRPPLLLLTLAALALAPLPGAPTRPTPTPADGKGKLTFKPGSKTPDETPVPAAAPAQPAPSPAAPAVDEGLRLVLGEFFDLLGRGEVDRAYDLLVRDSPIGAKKQEVDDLKTKSREAIRLFGTIQGHELVSIEAVGSRLWRITALSLGEGFPLRWRFYYYRPQEAWRLIDIRVDDSLPDLFGERRENGAAPR